MCYLSLLLLICSQPFLHFSLKIAFRELFALPDYFRRENFFNKWGSPRSVKSKVSFFHLTWFACILPRAYLKVLENCEISQKAGLPTASTLGFAEVLKTISLRTSGLCTGIVLSLTNRPIPVLTVLSAIPFRKPKPSRIWQT